MIIYSKDATFTIAMLFFLGMCAAGRITIGYVYLTEFLSERNVLKLAPIMNAAAGLPMLFGTATFQLITKETIYFEIVTLLFTFVMLVLVCLFIPESPKCLIASRRFDEARESLAYMAKFNGVNSNDQDFSSVKFQMQLAPSDSSKCLISSVNASEVEPQIIEGKLSDLWKYTQYRYNLLICIVLWMMCSFGDYGLVFVLKYLGGDIFINAYTQAIAEVIAKLSVGVFVTKTNLRSLFVTAYGFGAFGALLLCFNSQGGGKYVAVSVFIAKFGFCQAWPLIYLAIPILFPTALNATSMGICNCFAKVMTITSPLAAELTPPIPMVMLTSAGVIAACLSQLLQEPHKLSK